MASWGYYFKRCTAKNGRMGTAASFLVYSALIMIPINLATIYLSPYIGLSISILLLTATLMLLTRLPDEMPEKDAELPTISKSHGIAKPLMLLCVFIVIITIDSGLMFQMVNPAFEQVGWIANLYWAVPYIAAIFIVNRLPGKIDRSYILYTAIAMIGFSFIAFLLLDRSVASYLAINTLLLGACGINDLFWWSILGEMLDFHENPAKVLGTGLSANVLGVLLGELIANMAAKSGLSGVSSIIGLAAVFTALLILPLLYKNLSGLLKNHVLLAALYQMPPEEQKRTIDGYTRISGLTDRESQITAYLLKGYTYRMIASELFLSESTVKTHIQNIYCKLNVKNKTEMIQKLAK